ncbi:hypothetical protein QNI16_18990 [Cytophagaceae bacterium YF14B1]|uniref:Uncharacterized protein n=1 Tax=Xanthocytophaga flava TaxID=3048013 RepID=A0AAE3U765_9BACT|nr:hypothetical protein [Xanthocytophaga flavus]MDJ1482594.1 hypothetical protein [Xanthocytophaga flavus]
MKTFQTISLSVVSDSASSTKGATSLRFYSTFKEYCFICIGILTLILHPQITQGQDNQLLADSNLQHVSSKPVSMQNSALSDTTSVSDPDKKYMVYVFVNELGKVKVTIENPNRLRYVIRMVDHQDRVLYEEFTNLSQYRRSLDISGLIDSFCQVIVDIDNQPLTYKIQRKKNKDSYSIQNLPVQEQPIVTDKNKQKLQQDSVIVSKQE